MPDPTIYQIVYEPLDALFDSMAEHWLCTLVIMAWSLTMRVIKYYK